MARSLDTDHANIKREDWNNYEILAVGHLQAPHPARVPRKVGHIEHPAFFSKNSISMADLFSYRINIIIYGIAWVKIMNDQ